jgi:hypothetical protein
MDSVLDEIKDIDDLHKGEYNSVALAATLVLFQVIPQRSTLVVGLMIGLTYHVLTEQKHVY